MNEIVKREPTQVAVDGWDDTAAEAETRLIRGSLLRFADWKWSIGKEAIEVKEGRQLVTVATTAAWVKWREGKRVDYRLRESGGRLPDRDELGDNDRTQWELGPDGKEVRDPWQNTRFVDMLDPLTAEAFTFSTSSWGGTGLRDQSCRSDQAHAGQAPRCGAAG